MEQKIFDVEIFKRTLVTLKQLANAHQPDNDAALKAHNNAYFNSKTQLQKADEPFHIAGDESENVNLVPDVALVSNPEKVGRSLVEFISTIPGVVTEGMLDRVSRPESIALSDRAVSALLRRENGCEVGMSLTFAYEGWPKHKLQFDRTGPINKHVADRIAVSFEIGPDSLPIGGKIDVGEIEDQQAVLTRHSIQFDSNGIILQNSPKFDLHAGEKINIIKIIEQITKKDNLGETLNSDEIIENSKLPKLGVSS